MNDKVKSKVMQHIALLLPLLLIREKKGQHHCDRVARINYFYIFHRQSDLISTFRWTPDEEKRSGSD